MCLFEIHNTTILETGFNLSDIEFKTGDAQWWIVFDNKQNKIILKNVDLALVGNVLWDLDHEYVIFNLGTDLTRSLIFNSLIDKRKTFTISAVTNGDKLYYFSPNNNKIAFCYHGESNDDFYEPGIQEADKVWLGIKILDISSGSQTAIKPETDGGKLTINNWKSDAEIEYTETNNIITIEKKKGTYKL